MKYIIIQFEFNNHREYFVKKYINLPILNKLYFKTHKNPFLDKNNCDGYFKALKLYRQLSKDYSNRNNFPHIWVNKRTKMNSY